MRSSTHRNGLAMVRSVPTAARRTQPTKACCDRAGKKRERKRPPAPRGEGAPGAKAPARGDDRHHKRVPDPAADAAKDHRFSHKQVHVQMGARTGLSCEMHHVYTS